MLLRHACHKTIDALRTVNTGIADTGLKVAAAFLVTMVAIVLAQVFFRYVLNDSLVWAEELSKAMMVWVAFLVAPKALLTGANVKIEMLVESVPARLRAFLNLFIDIAVLWVLAIFFNESIGFWERGTNVAAASIPVPMSVFYTIVPLGFAALFLAALQVFLQDLLALITGAQDTSEHSDTGEGSL